MMILTSLIGSPIGICVELFMLLYDDAAGVNSAKAVCYSDWSLLRIDDKTSCQTAFVHSVLSRGARRMRLSNNNVITTIIVNKERSQILTFCLQPYKLRDHNLLGP